MVHHTEGLHHSHTRKRIHVHHEKFPHPDKFKHFMDKAIYFVGIFGPIMTIPQIYKIFHEKSAAGISVISWIAYLITAIFWFSYGVLHKEKPIIFTYVIWIFLDILIIIGSIMY